MRSELFSADNLEKESTQPGMRLQNSKMLKVKLNGSVSARQGSMVAYQGEMGFAYQGSGGMAKFLKKAFTGEGVPLIAKLPYLGRLSIKADTEEEEAQEHDGLIDGTTLRRRSHNYSLPCGPWCCGSDGSCSPLAQT